MPNPTNGVRDGPSKRPDQKKNPESSSPDSQGSSRRNIKGVQHSIDLLSHSNGALQRLAKISQLFESFTDDIQLVEDDYGAEIAKENTIRKLNETVESLAHAKSEEKEKLQQDNKRLMAERERYQEETKKALDIQRKVEDQHALAEASRKKESEQKLQEEKSKVNKALKAKKAELEDKYSKNFRDLEDKCKELSAANAELTQRYSEAEQTLETKKKRHARNKKNLEDENEKLKEALKQWQAQFPVEGGPIEY